MADMARYTVNNIAEVAGGITITTSYSDIIEGQPEEHRTADEIINSITSRLNGVQNELI